MTDTCTFDLPVSSPRHTTQMPLGSLFDEPHGLSTTKPGRLLKHQIPIRTFAECTVGSPTDGSPIPVTTEASRPEIKWHRQRRVGWWPGNSTPGQLRSARVPRDSAKIWCLQR